MYTTKTGSMDCNLLFIFEHFDNLSDNHIYVFVIISANKLWLYEYDNESFIGYQLNMTQICSYVYVGKKNIYSSPNLNIERGIINLRHNKSSIFYTLVSTSVWGHLEIIITYFWKESTVFFNEINIKLIRNTVLTLL